VSVHHLSRQEARRIVVRASLLSAERPTDLLAMVEHLSALPVEPTAAIAPSYDLLSCGRTGLDRPPRTDRPHTRADRGRDDRRP
jgi:hypothetical protein